MLKAFVRIIHIRSGRLNGVELLSRSSEFGFVLGGQACVDSRGRSVAPCTTTRSSRGTIRSEGNAHWRARNSSCSRSRDFCCFLSDSKGSLYVITPCCRRIEGTAVNHRDVYCPLGSESGERRRSLIANVFVPPLDYLGTLACPTHTGSDLVSADWQKAYWNFIDQAVIILACPPPSLLTITAVPFSDVGPMCGRIVQRVCCLQGVMQCDSGDLYVPCIVHHQLTLNQTYRRRRCPEMEGNS